MNIRRLVAEAIAATPPELLTDSHDANRFVEELLAKVNRADRPALIRRLGALARATGIDLPLPQILRPLPSPQPTRQAEWARQAGKVFTAAECLQVCVANRHGSPEDFAGRALASAILLGGLLRPEAWPAFWQALHDGPRFGGAKSMKELIWLELRIPRTAGRAAQDAEHEFLRFFPDVVTLSLIARAKGMQTKPAMSPQRLLGIAMRSIGFDDPGLTSETIRSAGFAMIEDTSPQPIPAILFEVARGAVPAFSATDEVWQSVFGAHRTTTGPIRRHEMAAQPAHAQAKKAVDIRQSVRDLSAAVMARTPGAHKQTRAPVVAALQRLLGQQPAPVIQGIAFWSLDLLARGRAPGTIRRYAPALARTLAGRLGNDNPAQMPPAQLEVLVEEALDLVPRAERLYRTARIAQLFDFASTDPRLAWPHLDLDVEGGSAPRVRTALLSPQVIAGALAAFVRSPVNQAAFLLGARGGLRLSDMEALRLGDVESGPDGMVRIHHTLWGSLKSPSARRMVPLGALLTPDELRLWDRFLANRRAVATSHDAPFLASGGGLLPTMPFERRHFAFELGRATGLHPHALRHGALSNLALVLLSPTGCAEILRSLTGWRERQCSALRERLVASDPWRGMNELANLAGHRDPATTLESYVHICDLALGMHLRAASPVLPASEAARCLGLNRRSLPSRRKNLRPEELRTQVLERLTITSLHAMPSVAAPPLPPEEIGVQLVLRIEGFIVAGKSAPEIADHFALPLRTINALMACDRPVRLKGLRDRRAAADLAMFVLTHTEGRAWALQVLKAPLRGISFSAPLAAEIWLASCEGQLRYRGELRSSHPDRWDRWAKRLHIQPPMLNRRDRLTLIPRSPDGVEGMKMARVAARLVLAVLAARNKMLP